MSVRLLQELDWQAWKNIRLEALKYAPEAFGSSYEEELKFSDEEFRSRLSKATIFGKYVGEQLVGCVGFYKMNGLKIEHRGVLWGLYVKPEYRGQGFASNLMNAVISHAKNVVIQLHLSCVTTNHDPIRLYERHGFSFYGTEPRSLKIGNIFYDEYLMILKLK